MKKHIIENEHLKVTVKETGAELSSLVNKKNDLEHIWQGDPEIWANHAPNLFPIIGALKESKYTFERSEFKLPKHGFIRYNEEIRLKERSNHQLVFELLYSESTLKIYPFKFNFRIAFTLYGNTLEVGHHITNLDNKPLYFSLGGHPAFNICLHDNEKISDYSVEFDTNMDLRSFILNSDGLISDETKPILDNERKIRLSENIFDEDALIFKNIESKKVNLVSKKAGKILSVVYKDFENLGLWAKPGASYVCIEPWLGIADLEDTDGNLKNKEGINELMPEKEFNASYYIQIEAD